MAAAGVTGPENRSVLHITRQFPNGGGGGESRGRLKAGSKRATPVPFRRWTEEARRPRCLRLGHVRKPCSAALAGSAWPQQLEGVSERQARRLRLL